MSSYYEKMLATGEVKCIDEEIPFEVPKGWKWCRIASLADVVRGGSPRPAGSPIFYDGSIPFLKVADLTRESSIYVKSFSSTIKEAGLSKTRLVGAGTLLLTNSGATLGVPKICTFETTFNDGIAAFLSLDERLKLYVYWFFCYMTDLYRNINQGTAQPNLNTDIIKMTLVPIPPYKEQIRIVEELGNVSPIIKHYEKAQDELDGLNESIPKLIKQSILQEAIRGKLVPQLAEEGTAQELLEQIKAEKQKLVKKGKLKKSALTTSTIFRGDDNKYYEQIGKKCLDITEQIPFEIPNSWTWARMGQVGDWGAGSTPQRGNQDYYGGHILWLKTGELNNDIVYDTEEKITQRAFQDCSLRMNKIGDVLIAMYGATIGKLAIVGKELTTNQACCGCTPYVVYNWFLFYFLMASRDSFIKKGEGGAQPNISRVKLVEHLIPLPPLNEQKRIVKRIETLFEQLH